MEGECMLYTYNFSIEKFNSMIIENIERNGEKGMLRDVDIIYYYLSQKYSHFEIKQIINQLNNVLEMSDVDIQKKLLFLSNND